ncbi:MAG: type II 3-dehydroquinate dehydratase [Nitrospiraceae bacterium]|nr:type II 3-dehydroquinate dehydratase [Nitrospiraceae bacterium]
MPKIKVIHGPNLNLLGQRETKVYGTGTLAEIDDEMKKMAGQLGFEISAMQTNSESEIIDAIQKSDYDLLIINPAAYTHTSVAIRDAISAIAKPVIEVHLSNIHKREEFRRHSFVAEVAAGQISGFGPESYMLALKAAQKILSSGDPQLSR